MTQSLNIVIISSDHYPDGGASANRHLAWSRGLAEIGNTVTFILLAPQTQTHDSFQIDGVKFISAFKRNWFSGFAKSHSSLVPVPAVRRARALLNQMILHNKVDVVILLNTHVWLLKPFLGLCKKRKIKVIHERTEYPLITIKRGFLSNIHYAIYRGSILQRLDGMFVITESLRRYFSEQLKSFIPIQVINMMVDPSRFSISDGKSEVGFRYIAYCGSMDIAKDGVDILIRAFGKALRMIRQPNDLRLLLIGSIPDNHLMKKYQQIIKESQCEDRVVFTGSVSRESIPQLLQGAEALALARPESKQAEGGFPTKLGEYLATGKPVVITNTGEISVFLQDGINAFIVNPGNVDSFVDKLILLFDDYPKAKEIGQKGKELVYNEFNYYTQAKRLNDFIGSILNTKR